IDDGSGLARFGARIRAQGGDPEVLDRPAELLGALVTTEVRAAREGVVAVVDTLAVGLAEVVLGAGRTRSDATIDPGVGFTMRRRPGERVEREEPLVAVHHRPGQDVGEVCHRLAAAFHISDRAGAPLPLFIARVEARPG